MRKAGGGNAFRAEARVCFVRNYLIDEVSRPDPWRRPPWELAVVGERLLTTQVFADPSYGGQLAVHEWSKKPWRQPRVT